MKNFNTPASRSTIHRTVFAGAQLVMAVSLVACSPDSADPAVESSQTAASITRPSVSAAELSNDGVNSISLAQAIAAGEIAPPEESAVAAPEESAVTIPETGAANPVTDNPLAVVPATNGTDTEATESASESNAQASGESEINTSDNTSGANTDNSLNGTDDSVDQDETELAESTVDTVEEAEADTQTANGSNNSGADSQAVDGDVVTRFESHTSPGFEGEVLSDSIKVTWKADPNARGYNVYKQAEYITTVFATEYIDTEVFDRDYYYEIQAFDHSDVLYYIATGLTVKARTLGKIDPDMPVPDPDLLKDYELVFSDEFNNTELDSTKWNTSYLWGDELIINSEEQHYVDIVNEPDFGFNPFTFDGNNLTINSIETPPELLSKANNQPYLSGVITSYDAFKFTYGYIETRAKVTFGRGYWPAFWLLNAYYVDDKPEIDIMEFIGDNQDVVYHTYHYYDSDGNLRSTKSEPTPGIDYTNDFHTYAAEWKPGVIVFYVDGIEVHRITDSKVSRQEMYVIANTALGGWWAGSPDSTTPFPGTYTLDYIRVYQKNGPIDDFLLDDGPSSVPFADDIPGQVAPNHRPTPEQWPEGYPDGL